MAKDLEYGIILVATWDLVSNIETSMFQIKTNIDHPSLFLVRGIQPSVKETKNEKDLKVLQFHEKKS